MYYSITTLKSKKRGDRVLSEFVGINFGTTNTAVFQILDNEYGRKHTPLGDVSSGSIPFSSIVAIPYDGGPLLFGREVRERRNELSSSHAIFTSMKSYLGKKDSNGNPTVIIVNEKKYHPKEIVAAFFRYIIASVKKQHDVDLVKASLSYPADFSSDARRELQEAAESAGIKVAAFVNEATAAFIANYSEGKSLSRVMVLDWGGGTFDISLLRLLGSSIEEIAVWGDHIGGDDIDVELAERAHARIARDSEISGKRFDEMEPSERDTLISLCERAKIEISDFEEDYLLPVRNYGAYGARNITIKPEQLDDIVESKIKSGVLPAIKKALENGGGFSPRNIDCIIVVGGSSSLGAYRRFITNLFENAKILLPDHAQWATANGAALMQIVGANYRLNNEIGVLLSDGDVETIIPKGYAIGERTKPKTFSLVEEAFDAHFIFTNESGKVVYSKNNVHTKGFLNETMELTALIGFDQIARVDIENKGLGVDESRVTTVELNKLNFHYDIGALFISE